MRTGTWLARSCNTDGPIPAGLSQHKFDVAAGTDTIYTEIEWADKTQLIYLVLYDPACNEAGVSAGLLDIGSVNHRALLVAKPAPVRPLAWSARRCDCGDHRERSGALRSYPVLVPQPQYVLSAQEVKRARTRCDEHHAGDPRGTSRSDAQAVSAGLLAEMVEP